MPRLRFTLPSGVDPGTRGRDAPETVVDHDFTFLIGDDAWFKHHEHRFLIEIELQLQ